MLLIYLTPQDVISHLQLLAKLAGQKTPTFISIKNYRNNEGEVSNYVINIGASYENAKKLDTEFLSNPTNIEKIDFEGVAMYKEQARIALLEANKKPSNQSIAQQEAYTTVFPNVRVHNETGRVYIFGFKISKQVITPIQYKSVNHSPLTIAKDKIRKQLKAPNFRQYCTDKLVSITMKGETLEFEQTTF